MQETKAREAAEHNWSPDPQISEITLPFRIVCARHESEDGPIFEVKTLRTPGKSLLEPRD